MLGGKYDPNDEFEQAAVDRAKQQIEQNTKRGEVSDPDREMILARKLEQEARDELEKRRRATVTGTAKYKTILVDPLNPDAGFMGEDAAPVVKRPAGKPPTPQQAKFLAVHGYNPDRYNRKSAGFMIGKIRSGALPSKKNKQYNGGEFSEPEYELPPEAYGFNRQVTKPGDQATPEQRACLENNGRDPNVTQSEAQWVITHEINNDLEQRRSKRVTA